MIILWKDDYLLGFHDIDEQHKQFVRALGELINAVSDVPSDKEKIESVFQKMTNYSTYHFRTEEKYFDDFHYEGATAHKAEHEKFCKKIEELKRQYMTDQMNASFNLADFLEDWLVNHLVTMDRKYVDCFRKHGLT